MAQHHPMDVVTAKAKGAAKAIAARQQGLTGVFRTLAKQHGEAAELIERLKAAPDKCEQLWPKIRVALLSHEKGELHAVYPALNRFQRLKKFAKQHAEEAADLEDMIERLDSSELDEADWMYQFARLGDAVVAHATEEETQIFPAALEVIGDDRAKELDEKYKDAHKKLEASLKKKTVH
jgi:hemerythrin superfamily protein